MGTLFAITLAAHVVLGILGVIFCYAVLLQLLKKVVSLKIATYSALLAFASYMLSWLTGGYYYVFYYGSQVKPGIKEGAYPWAHLVFMEAKEHIFLMLPFATLALWVALYTKGSEIDSDSTLKTSLMWLSAVITILATVITLSGIIITGAGR